MAPTGTRLPLARQAVVDETGRRIGYELLFRGDDGSLPGGDGWDAAAQDSATSRVISAAFGGFSPASLGDDGLLFLNLTRSFLVGDVALPFEPAGVVLEVLEDIPVDDDLVAGICRLRTAGYVLALDDFVGEAERLPLVPLVDVVKVDVMALRRAGGTPAEVAVQCRAVAPGVVLLAERVEDEETAQECRDAGYALFQGFWFDRPSSVLTLEMSPSQVICMRLVAVLSQADVDPVAVEDLVREDPALGLRVLRWVGSAGAGSRTSVRSLRQALVLLGSRTLSSWVLLAMLGGSPTTHGDVVAAVLTRARTCELLADSFPAGPDGGLESELYTVGLLSAIADLTEADPGQLARDTRLGPEAVAALVDGSGALGLVLQAVRDHESGAPATTSISSADVARAHLHALGSALATVRGMRSGSAS